ncbi:serine hydrolase domain-containing protein [Xanthovirga aplysinae]|uniref:serine hydrolase domain-containing protein n=1 Tax=Xanthovirga aplysinae TaxID=2529853 RepID=UPI0012BC7AF5|nr:serine hydrolase domain-containing protein [Xanthovirga aplysinae]MTI32149.1 serine hydrolase [Xanthovirga aplysinae]
MKRKFIIIIGFTQFLFWSKATVNAQVAGDFKALESKIDNYLTDGVGNGFSGAILVSKEGKVILNKGYGMANKEKNILNTPKTVFDIGSNTKQFTGAAILKLVEFNKLKFTDKLSKFFNDLPKDKQNITVHQLLTHSAGWKESFGQDFDHISRELFFQDLFTSELLHEPGTKYSYSNVGYSILARIIELVSGEEYETFLNEHLFKPAGMQQTGYLIPHWDRNLLARGYNRNVLDRGSMVTRYLEDGKVSWHLKGNGGINSTQEDMFKWYQALKTNKVLTKSYFEKFIKPYIGPEKGRYQYAYGWGISYSDRNTTRISHNGSNGAFSHSLIWNFEEDVVIIYATNSGSPEVERIAYTVEKMIFDENYQAGPIKKNPYFFVFDFTKANPPKKAKELLTLIKKEHSQDFENSKVLNRIGYIIIEAKNDLDWAIELFKLNVQLFPDEGNVWDSLGDGYLANGQKEEAIESFKKAVELNNEDSIKKLNDLLFNNE